MRDQEINEILWDIQYLANQSTGYSNRISVKEALVAKLFNDSGVIKTAFFADPNSIEKNYGVKTNLLFNAVSYLNYSTFFNELIPVHIAAPLDEQGVKQGIKDEYLKLVRNTKNRSCYVMVHFVPLPVKNTEFENELAKKTRTFEIRKRLDEWLRSASTTYFYNTFDTWTSQELKGANVTNNFHCPIFLVTNVEISKLNGLVPTDQVYIYVGIIDNETQQLHWIKVSYDFFAKKSHIHYNPVQPIVLSSLDFTSWKNAEKIELENRQYLIYGLDNDKDLAMFLMGKKYIKNGDPAQWIMTSNKEININDKNLLPEVQHLYDELVKWEDNLK